MLPGSPQPISSDRDRQLVTAFPSPAKVPAFASPIPGSMVPTCYFAAWLQASLPGPPFCSTADSGLPRRRPLHRFWPVAVPPAARLAASPISTPLQGFCTLPDQSVPSVLLPVGPPSESARFPLAPRCRSFSSATADHRSWFATFPEACSELLVPRFAARTVHGLLHARLLAFCAINRLLCLQHFPLYADRRFDSVLNI